MTMYKKIKANSPGTKSPTYEVSRKPGNSQDVHKEEQGGTESDAGAVRWQRRCRSESWWVSSADEY